MDLAELRSQMGPGASDIAQIVPEVRQLLPDLEPPPILEPEQARFRLFDSITSFLKNAAQSQPLMLVLEDLHWADHSSLMLWEFVSKEISSSKVMLLGTYRDVEVGRRHPLSQALGSLIREPSFRRVQLGGLSKQEASRLVELSSGVTLAEPSLDLIHSRTEGNPLFLSEIVRLVGEGSTGAGDSWTSTLPEGVKDIIGRRLDRLSAQCNDTLTVASVIGREFSLEQLKSLIDGLTEDGLLEVLEEAQSARVIEESPGTGDRFRFSHALIQETVASELTTARRVRLHARIAEGLEQLYGANVEAHAAKLAHHFAEAEAVLGTEKLVRYSLLAGERALNSYAHEEALVHFHKGLAARGVPIAGDEPAVDSEIAALLSGLGRAQVATLPLSELQEAAVTLARSFDYYAKEGDIDQVLAIAEHPFPPTAGRHIGVLQIIERALELVPSASRQSGRLLARYGWLMGVEDANYEGSRDSFAQAMDIARSEGDTVLALQTLISAAEVELFYLHWEDVLSKSLEVIELLSKISDPRAEMLAHFFAQQSYKFLGDSVEAERHARDSVAAAERLHHHFYLGRALQSMGWLSYCKGEWQAARDFNDQGLAASPRETRLLHARVILEYEVGNFSDGKAYLDRLLEVMRLTAPGPVYEYAFPAMVIPMAARISGDRDWLAVAQAAAENVFSSPSVTPMVAAMTRTGLALLAVQRGDVAAAKQLYEGLERHEIGAPLGIQPDRLLGLLAQTTGNLDKAADHFEDALSFCRKAGYRPELAWTCCDYADALLAVAPGRAPSHLDHQKAMSLLEESLSIATELGMRPLIERVVALQVRAETGPVRGPVYPDGLTPREVEVLRLIAAGKSNSEIAEQLFISVNTVARHLTNIYTKTGVVNRTEAAIYASQQDFLQE